MPLRFGEFSLDEERRQVFRGTEALALEPKAYELLDLLIARRPRALSKAQILGTLWPGTFVAESTLAGVVADLRSALGDTPHKHRFIRTLHGFGYAFSGDSTRRGARSPRVHGRAGPRRVAVFSHGLRFFGREMRKRGSRPGTTWLRTGHAPPDGRSKPSK